MRCIQKNPHGQVHDDHIAGNQESATIEGNRTSAWYPRKSEKWPLFADTSIAVHAALESIVRATRQHDIGVRLFADANVRIHDALERNVRAT